MKHALKMGPLLFWENYIATKKSLSYLVLNENTSVWKKIIIYINHKHVDFEKCIITSQQSRST